MKHNWEYKKLGDICSIVGRIGFRGYTREDLVEKGNGAISLSPSNIIDGKLNFDDKVSYLSWEKYFESPEIMLAEGDVVFTKTASIGKCALVKHLPVETTLNPQLVVLKNIQCDSSYLTYMLQDKRFQEAVLSKKGGTSIPTISQAFLGSLPVPVPPIETQKQIVAELDKINETIEDCRELLRNLDALSQSLFYDYFGDPAINPKGWQTKSLDEICEAISTGITYKPDNVADFGTIVLRSSNIQNSSLVLDDIVRIDMPLKPSQYVQKNDILMCSRNGSARLVGKVALIPELKEKMSWGAFMTIIRSNYYHFLFQYFRLPAFREQLTKTKTTTVNQITIGMLKKIHLPVPPLSLQKKFAERIEQIEAQKKVVEDTIAELQTLLDSRMDYWFN